MSATIFLHDVFKVGSSFVVTGKVEEGILKIGMKLDLGKKVVSVTSIEQGRTQLKTAGAGNIIGFMLDAGPEDLNSLQKLPNSRVTLTE